MKTVALDLQPCVGRRSGIGNVTYELSRRVHDTENTRFVGNVFCFGREKNTEGWAEHQIPVRACRLLPYGVYRRIWNAVPLPYETFFPSGADLSVFFDYVVPPRISGKVMTTVHDMSPSRFPEFMQESNRRRIEGGLQRSIERCERLLTISEFSKREIVELLHYPADRIHVIYPAPSLKPGTADFDELKARYGLRDDYLLYVGNIEQRKNLSVLLRAFARLKKEAGIPHQLVLAGGTSWGSEEIIRQAEPMIASGQIVMTGYISSAEKNTLYEHAACFAFPSLYEGFGIPPLEAMHFGCPVICSTAGSLPEVVGDAAMIVEPQDELGLSEAIHSVLSDPSLAETLRRRGFARTKVFSWDHSAEQLMQLCEAVLS